LAKNNKKRGGKNVWEELQKDTKRVIDLYYFLEEISERLSSILQRMDTGVPLLKEIKDYLDDEREYIERLSEKSDAV
jgi:hypothetical protein